MEQLQQQNKLLQADIDDAAELVKLINSAYRGEESTRGWTTEAHLLLGPLRTDTVQVKEYIQKPGSTIIKYVEGNKIHGCVYLEKQGARLYLGMLSVSPTKQAAGIGKKLLSAAEAHAKSLGCASIIMTVISVREELIAWYERHGYVKTGTSKPFPVDEKYGKPTQQLILIDFEKLLKVNS
jgi:ribosomal protein S18 acetylase RimI-like enzyme